MPGVLHQWLRMTRLSYQFIRKARIYSFSLEDIRLKTILKSRTLYLWTLTDNIDTAPFFLTYSFLLKNETSIEQTKMDWQNGSLSSSHDYMVCGRQVHTKSYYHPFHRIRLWKDWSRHMETLLLHGLTLRVNNVISCIVMNLITYPYWHYM